VNSPTNERVLGQTQSGTMVEDRSRPKRINFVLGAEKADKTLHSPSIAKKADNWRKRSEVGLNLSKPILRSAGAKLN